MYYSSLYENKKRGTFDFPIELYSLTSASPRYQMPFHWHLDYELILITSGSFALTLDGKTFLMNGGDCAWVGSGVIHGGIPSDCVYECVVFDLGTLLHDTPVCARSAASFLSDESEYTGVFPCGSPQASLSGQLMRAMREEQKGYEWTTVGLMWQLMGSLIASGTSSPALSRNRSQIRKMKNVLAYIKDHYEDALTLTALAELAGMTPKYFCRAFSHMTGKTPIEYLNYYRIEQAGEKLLLTDRSITDIAMSCGFNDMSYFSRTFSRYKGMTPTGYRKARNRETGIRSTRDGNVT